MNIVEVAKKYIGIREIPENQGWYKLGTAERDVELEARFSMLGWRSGYAWCSLFAKLVWLESLPEPLGREAMKMISPGAVQTWNNAATFGWMRGSVPIPGAIAIWGHKTNGKFDGRGHAGICVSEPYVRSSAGQMFLTIEGNTNEAGGREGDCVAQKERAIKSSGPLVLKGFIYPERQTG